MFPHEEVVLDEDQNAVIIENSQADKPHEECGIVGIYAPGREVARRTFFALYALQHRGQEAAGIVTCDGHMAHVHKGMGLVSQVFNEDNLRHLQGHMAIGHNRYSQSHSLPLSRCGCVDSPPHLHNSSAKPLESTP